MVIDSYGFGSITIDGVVYSKDLMILRGEVTSPWFRQAGGHLYAPEDLALLIEAAPDVVLLGTGYFGRVKVLEQTRSVFADAGTEVLVDRTARIVPEFNRLIGEGRDVAAALHLTC